MSYTALTFISTIIFVMIHLWAGKMQLLLDHKVQGRFLSAGSGIAIAYVFIDLLPKLAKSDLIVRRALEGLLPYFERHVYIMALMGFLLFFIVDQKPSFLKKQGFFWLSLLSYILFNFLVGYAIVDKNNPEVKPLALFTIAMAFHYFNNDFSLNKEHGKAYQRVGKWLLILSLFLGWFAGLFITLSRTAIALASAFIAGGVMMNVMRHELPKENPHSLGSFLFFVLLYTGLLLAIG